MKVRVLLETFLGTVKIPKKYPKDPEYNPQNEVNIIY